MDHVTGDQARELLEGTTEGEWSRSKDRHLTNTLVSGDRTIAICSHYDVDLIAAAPALAETVAWLYGRESDDEGIWDDHYQVSAMADGRVAVFDHEATTTFFTPDETVEFARAMLAAAERARNH